ncbi:hypothetical protein [Roseateles sp.]|uniref:hypothetical protein n=1 Tax=Roseateles sp. TaxID=1971397 RepID=UPI0025DB22EF|nr:hypothetical protein [Roseateles sp.]MBV8035909.1 hypothetical protein [Roseateles sp.]
MATTLTTLADASQGRAAKAAPTAAPRGMASGPLQASISLPAVGVTVSFSPQAVDAAASLAQAAVKLGSGGAQLIGDAAHAVADAAGTVVEGGIVAVLAGGALLGALR